MGLGLPSDNNFQPIASFVSSAMLGNEKVVGVTFLGYGEKHVTCLWEYIYLDYLDSSKQLATMQGRRQGWKDGRIQVVVH